MGAGVGVPWWVLLGELVGSLQMGFHRDEEQMV